MVEIEKLRQFHLISIRFDMKMKILKKYQFKTNFDIICIFHISN